MIDCVTISNAHLFGNALASMFRLRYRVFIQQGMSRAMLKFAQQALSVDQAMPPRPAVQGLG